MLGTVQSSWNKLRTKTIPRFQAISNLIVFEQNSHNFFFTSKKFILDTVKILLDYGADVYIKNNDGQTCLDILSKIEYYDEIKKLIDDHTCFDIKGALD